MFQPNKKKSLSLLSQISVLLILFLFYGCSEDPSHKFTIEAVDYDRPPAPNYFHYQDSLIDEGLPYLVAEGSSEKLAVQPFGEQWVFIPGDTIPAGKSVSYSLYFADGLTFENVASTQSQGSLQIKTRDKSVLGYQMKTMFPPSDQPAYYQRGGFIHPAYAPNGEQITDDFPVGHTHQHGIFFAWVNTLFNGRDTDFWNQQDETGTVIFDSLISVEDGPVYSEFQAAQTAIAFDGEDSINVLAEVWNIRVYNLTDYFLWDIRVRQENISDNILQVLPYHYGGMAFRGSAEWNDTTSNAIPKGKFLTSEGLTRLNGNHSRPNWVSMYGDVNNKPVGLAVLGYNKNFRAPQYVRIHPSMPYFCFTPVVEYGLDFKANDVHMARYRVLTFNGKPDPVFIEQMWKQYQTLE